MSSTVIPSQFRDEVLAVLEELHWSQGKLARKIRRHPTMVSKLLRGDVVSAVTKHLIVAALERERARRRSLA